MRPIKFRAIISDKTTIHLDLTDLIHPARKDLFSKRELLIPWLLAGNEPDEFTGLKDKNGVEIYEGDILAIYHTDKKHYGVRSLWQVTSELTSWGYDFCWENISGYECSTHVMREDPINYEVIGNIYENPELLKGG